MATRAGRGISGLADNPARYAFNEQLRLFRRGTALLRRLGLILSRWLLFVLQLLLPLRVFAPIAADKSQIATPTESQNRPQQTSRARTLGVSPAKHVYRRCSARYR